MSGGLGTLVGAGLGYALAPATGGMSLLASTSLGATLGGAAGSMLGGGPKGLTSSNMGTSQNSTSTPNVPSWLLPYLQSNATAANGLAQRPYQPYTGQQVAGLTDMQNQAGQLSQNLATNNQAANTFGQANQIQSSVANQGLNGINPQTIQNYMNPYTQQVMDASRLRQQQQLQLEQNQLSAQQGQIGAFGGSRASLAQGQLYNNFSQQLSQNESTQLQNNFTNAENMSMQGLGQANTAAQGMMQGAAGAQTAQLQNIGALQTAGGLQQTTNQNNLNAQYQDYLNAQAYPYQSLQNSQNILNPIASLTTGTNATGFNQQTGSPSVLQSLTGLGMTAASLANSGMFSGFGNLFNSNNINANPSSNGSFNTGLVDTGMNAADMSGISSSYGEGMLTSGYKQGGLVDGEATIPGIPTRYGMKAEQTPYTHQSPAYLIPAYKKGGQIPLSKGLTSANIGGIKREREHWGQPYVPMDKAAQGYLRPNIKNAFSHGGLVAHYGVPAYEDGGGPVVSPDSLALSSGAIYADMAEQGQIANYDNQPSLVDAMLNKATEGVQTPTRRPVSNVTPTSGEFVDSSVQPMRPDAIPDAGRQGLPLNGASILPGGEIYHSDNAATPDTLFSMITGAKKPGGDPVADAAKARMAHDVDTTGNVPSKGYSNPGIDGVLGAAGNLPVNTTKPIAGMDTTATAPDALQALAMNMSKPVSEDQQQPASNKVSPDDIESTVMKRIMDRQSSGINLPLMAMGAAILGDRSNSFMGALGAGEKAYVGTTQEQNKSDLDSIHQMAMNKYYGAKADATAVTTPARLAEMAAKTAKYVNDVKQNGGKANPYSAAYVRMKSQNPFMDDTQIEAELKKAGYNAPEQTGGVQAAGSNVTQEQYEALPVGGSYMWNGQILTKN